MRWKPKYNHSYGVVRYWKVRGYMGVQGFTYFVSHYARWWYYNPEDRTWHNSGLQRGPNNREEIIQLEILVMTGTQGPITLKGANDGKKINTKTGVY